MSKIPVHLDTTLSFEERAKALVSQMTLEEKLSQLKYDASPVPRLGVPAYNWWNEALHGVARAGVATMFPQAIGMAATFDAELLYTVADVISTEGRAKYHEAARHNDRGIYKGLTFWSPNINIFRDPRWGRGHETYGEDPYLTGRLGVAFVKGLQGNDPKYLKTAACAKHYAVHSGPENLRHSFNAVVSKKDLRETYLPAFKECVKEAEVESVMGAYNRTNDEPCCGSKTLLTDILRKEWGFKGHVVSDCWAICDFHLHHMITATEAESAAMALNNGCDLNCGKAFTMLMAAYKDGLVSEEAVNTAVERLMTTRMKLGMFDDDSMVSYASIPFEVNDCEEHKKLALEVSKRVMVLLKNKKDILPLSKNSVKTLGVIGPNADSRTVLEGNYSGTASEYITVLEGIKQTVSKDTRVLYSQGSHLYKDKVEGLGEVKDRFAEAISVAERSDIVILCLGLDSSIEGEEGDASNEYAAGDKRDLNLPVIQQQLLETIVQVGKPVILVLLAGSALAVNFADENVEAIIQAWYPGAQGGRAIAELVFGNYSPSGRLPVTFYKSTEELPDFCDYSMKNRTYRYMETEALYPFGFGLSYTNFEYSDIKVVEPVLAIGNTVKCSVTVANSGKMAGHEIVQLYVKDVEASVEVPKYQLKGIRNLFLKPQQSQTVEFELCSRDLAIISDEGKCILEPGKFEVFIGGSQPDERSKLLTGKTVLKAGFELDGEAVELEY